MGYSRPLDLTGSQPVVRGQAAPAESKLLGLELLRFVSALAVLFFHYSHFAAIAGTPPVARDAQPYYALLWPLYDYGQFGVQIFWGISGYIFFWKYGAAIHTGAVQAKKFFWLRFSRLYPLHLVTLLAVAGLSAWYRSIAGGDLVFASGDSAEFVRHLLFATQWGAEQPFTFNGPVWSVSAEVLVYAGFFLAVKLFAPNLRLCLAVTTVLLGLQVVGFDLVPVACASYFFAGGAAALLAGNNYRTIAAALTGAILLLGWASGWLVDRDHLPMLLLALIPPLLVALTGPIPLGANGRRLVMAAGNLTYSSYMLHYPLQLVLAISVMLGGMTLPLASPWFLLAYLGVTLTVAAVSYRAFELPAQEWLRRRTLPRRA